MIDLVRMIDNGNLIGLVALVATLCFVGRWMVGNDQSVRRFGLLMAGLSLFLYGTYRWLTAGDFEPTAIQGVLIRSLIAAGLSLGFFWIVGVGAFFCLRRFPKDRRQQMLQLATGVLSKRTENAEAPSDEDEPLETEPVPDAEAEVEVEVQSNDKVHREKAKLKKLQAKRKDLEYELRLIYNQLVKDGRPVFPADEFEKLMSFALGAETEAMIKKRVSMLRNSMQTSAEQDGGPVTFKTIDDVALYYQKQRLRVQDAEEYDEDNRRRILEQINRIEGLAIQRHIKENL